MLGYRESSLSADPNPDLCAIPVASRPDGLPPNFENPPSLQPAVIAVVAIILPFAIVITTGRLYVNRKAFKLADYFMMFGLVLDIAIVGILLAQSKSFRHSWDVPICWMDATYKKLTFVEALVVGPALFFPKAAIFLFYLQLFSVKRSIRIGSKVGLVLTFLAYIPASLSRCYFDAPHVGQTWEDLSLSEMVKNGIPSAIAVGVASVIVDIYVFVLPLPTLFSLNMGLSKRIQLLALFATAFMGIVASIICLAFRIRLVVLNDGGWQLGQVAITIIVENNVAIIVGSLPAFANFLRLHVAESAVYKLLRSKISRIETKSRMYDSNQKRWHKQGTLKTFGSPMKRQPQRHELSDTALLNSQITVPEETMRSRYTNDEPIIRTVEFSREKHVHQSSETLV